MSLSHEPKVSRAGKPHGNRRAVLLSEHQMVMALARAVRARRVALGLTQADLAGLSRTGIRFISELERGKPSIALGKLADALVALGLTLRAVPIQGPTT